MSTITPISDLSYRGYDGPLASPRMRWWVIARSAIQENLKKRWLWVTMVMSGSYYLLMMAVVFFVEQASQAASGPMGDAPARGIQDFLGRIVWKDQFIHGFSTGQLWYLFMLLMIGAGAIANDNRTNALLVYLSKPCDKRDYLLGKWVGVYLTILIMMSIPAAFFFLYGAMTYGNYGFLSADPWMGPKILAFLAISGAFHASLILGVSSLFKQGRIAGATYAAVYFLTNFFTQLMVITWVQTSRASMGGEFPEQVRNLVGLLYYASIDGLHIGLAKAVMGTDGSAYLGIQSPIPQVPAPALWIPLVAGSVLSALALAVAWTRIRAVEVVQ
ncbi:MAG: ABC transporter permease subunit [Fimbriimonadaceae bacterium]